MSDVVPEPLGAALTAQIDGKPTLAGVDRDVESRARSAEGVECRVGGNPAPGPAMSKPTTPASR